MKEININGNVGAALFICGICVLFVYFKNMLLNVVVFILPT